MEKFIPYEKLSKKKQRELNKARRGTWTINPVTRKPANPKAYHRQTARKWKDDSSSVPFGFLPPGRQGAPRQYSGPGASDFCCDFPEYLV